MSPGPYLERILMTADAVGGVWTYAIELITELRKRKVEVFLATMGAPLSSAQRRQVAELNNVKLFESKYKLEWMEEPWRDVREAGRWLLEIERECEPDLIHLNGYAHGCLRWNAPVLMAGHSCVLSWWQAVRGTEAPSNWDEYRRAVTTGLRCADIVVAPTQAMLSRLETLYGPFRRAMPIYNGRELPKGCAPPKEDFIFTAGRIWDEAKNISALDKIACDLEWPVYSAGGTCYPGCGKVKLENISPLGNLNQPEITSWYRRAAIYALPARYEPFGLTILEAALCGCALVIGDIPSLRELWDGAALFVPPDRLETIRDIIRELIRNAEERKRLADQARMRAAGFSRERMAQGYLCAYKRISGLSVRQ